MSNSSPAEAPSSSVNSRVQSSTGWVFAAYLVQQGVRLAANLVLTRILLPDAFALMALVLIVLMGVEMLSDVGIRASVLRDEKAERVEFYQTAWTLQTIRGLILAALVAAISVPVAAFYEQPELRNLLLVVAIVPIIHGLEHTGVYLAERRLTYFKVFLAHVSEPLIAAPIGIFIAISTGSVWALAAMAVLGMTARVVMGHILFRSTPIRFRMHPESAWSMVHFGKWILLSTAISWLMFQIDRMSLGKLVELKTLGIYSIALMWAEVPLLAARRWVGSIFYPLVSNWFRNSPDAGEQAARYRQQVCLAAAIPFGIGLGLAGPIMNLLYEPPFTESATFLSILLIAAWIGVMEEMYLQMLMAWGQPRKRMWACGAAVVTFLVLLYPLFNLYGAWGVALARVFAMLALLAGQWWGLRPHAPVSLLQDAIATVPMLAVAALTWLLSEFLTRTTGPLASLGICAVLGAAVTVAVIRHNRERLFTNPGA